MTSVLVGVRCLWNDVKECVSLLDFPSDDSVSTLLSTVAGQAAIDIDQLAVVYCGRVVGCETKLMDCSSRTIHGSKFVYVTRRIAMKPGGPKVAQSPMESVEMLLTSVQTAMMDTQHRNILMSLIGNSEGFCSLVASTPGLRDDLVAQAIIKDPNLVLACLAGQNGPKIVADHPCLVMAIEQLLGSLHAEASRLAPEVNAAMFEEERDEDDSDEEGQQPANPAPPAGAMARGVQLTPAQLAAALTAAAGNPQTPHRPQPQPQGQTAAPSSQITKQQLQQILMGAMAGGSQAQPTPQTSQAMASPAMANLKESLSSLHAMGFTNDKENMQALTAAKGDLEAALAIIVDKRESDEMPLD